MREGIYKAKGERQTVTGSAPMPSPPSRTCGFPNIFCGSKVLGLFFLILFLIFLLIVV